MNKLSSILVVVWLPRKRYHTLVLHHHIMQWNKSVSNTVMSHLFKSLSSLHTFSKLLTISQSKFLIHRRKTANPVILIPQTTISSTETCIYAANHTKSQYFNHTHYQSTGFPTYGTEMPKNIPSLYSTVSNPLHKF